MRGRSFASPSGNAERGTAPLKRIAARRQYAARVITPFGVWRQTGFAATVAAYPRPMSTTFFASAEDRKHGVNPLGLKGIDHIEFIVDNADQWRDFFVGKYGMSCRYYADAHSGVPGRRAHVVGQGRINFLVAEPAGTGPEADFLRWHLDRHGCGVRDVAFRVKDARFALAEAARRGAQVIRPLDEH